MGVCILLVQAHTATYMRYVCQDVAVHSGCQKFAMPLIVIAARDSPEHLVFVNVMLRREAMAITHVTVHQARTDVHPTI